jgi:uncharacterized membrane protein
MLLSISMRRCTYIYERTIYFTHMTFIFNYLYDCIRSETTTLHAQDARQLLVYIESE